MPRIRDRNYCATCNNPELEPDFATSPSKVKYCVYQLEMGEQGTLHYQISIVFVNAITIKSAIKALGTIFGKSCHVEVTQDIEASFHYCQKPVDGCQCEHCVGATRIEGPWIFGSKPEQGARNDLKGLAEFMKNKRSIAEVLCDPDFGYKIARVMPWAKAFIEANSKNQDTFDDELSEDNLLPYQREVVNICANEKPKRRRIIWVHSRASNVGKSTLGRFLAEKHGAVVLNVSLDSNNLLGRYLTQYNGQRIIVLDVPRNICKFDIPKLLHLLEKLSDGGRMGGDFGHSEPKNVCAHIVLLTNLDPFFEALPHRIHAIRAVIPPVAPPGGQLEENNEFISLVENVTEEFVF